MTTGRSETASDPRWLLGRGGRLEAVISVVAAMGARYLQDLVVGRTSGVVTFGEYAVVLALALVLSSIASGGLPELANRQIPLLVRQGRSEAVRSFVRLGVVTSLVCGVAVGSVAAIVGASVSQLSLNARAGAFLIVLVPVLALFNLKRQQALLSGQSRLGLFSPALTSGIAAALILFASDLFGLRGTTVAIGAVVISYVALVVIQGTTSRVDKNSLGGSPATVQEKRAWRRGGGAVVVGNAATVLSAQMDLLVIGFFATPIQTGVYAASSRLALLVTLALGGLIPRETPIFGRLLAQDKPDECWREFRRACTISGVLGLSTFLLLLLAGREILDLYVPGASIGYVWLSILAGGRCLTSLVGPAGEMLIVMGKQRTAAIASWSGLIIGSIFMVGLGSALGPIGVAIGSTVGVTTRALAQLFAARRAMRQLRSAPTRHD